MLACAGSSRVITLLARNPAGRGATRHFFGYTSSPRTRACSGKHSARRHVSPKVQICGCCKTSVAPSEVAVLKPRGMQACIAVPPGAFARRAALPVPARVAPL